MTKIVLIDGEELTQLMIDLGVTTQRTYAVKRIDSDFFREEWMGSSMSNSQFPMTNCPRAPIGH